MSEAERYGTRDLTYSNWHRIASIKRFVGLAIAKQLTMIDLDGLEYCYRCRECVGVIETSRDIGQAFKPSVVTRKLADRLGVPGLLVFYSIAEDTIGTQQDIDAFRVRLIAPTYGPETNLKPREYADWIVRLHVKCPCEAMLKAEEQRMVVSPSPAKPADDHQEQAA